MPRYLSAFAMIALVLSLLDIILLVGGVGLGVPFTLTTIAVILLCLGIIIKT